MAVALNARETAYRELRSRIINLDLKPNDVLNDKELAQEMGMSRTPIREAIITLGQARLVVIRPQSGTYVAPIDTKIVEMEQFCRFAMEKEMILRAIPCVTEEARQMYWENLHLYQFYLGAHLPDRRAKLFDLDNQFHRIAFQICQKESYFDWMESSRHHIERVRALSSLMDLNDTLVEEHEQIAKATVEGDAEGAIQALKYHLTRYQGQIETLKEVYPHYF